MNTKTLGDAGEAMAEQYLVKKGCAVLARKFRAVCGEVDLIVRDQKTLVFVEVKARSSDRFGTPGQAVTERKQRKIIQTAECYLQAHGLADGLCRFDVLEIYYRNAQACRINWLKNAFELV